MSANDPKRTFSVFQAMLENAVRICEGNFAWNAIF